MKYIIIILITLLSVSCGRKIVPEKTEIHDTLKIIKTVKYRDTVFKVMSADVNAILPLDKIGWSNIDKSDKQAQLTVNTHNDTVYINCHCDTLAIKARLRDSIIQRSKTKSTVKTQYIKEKFTPWYITALAWLGGLFLLIVVIIIIKKIKS